MAASTQEALKEVRLAEIDAKIHDLEQAIIALKRERNAFSPACQLPYDILVSLFQCVTEDALPSLSLSLVKSLTHTCSRWRAAALDEPILWTGINCVSKGYVIAMLQRSKNALLFVDHRMVKRDGILPDTDLIQAVLDHLPRIRSLKLTLPAHCFKPEILEKLFSPAFALETCTLDVWQARGAQQPPPEEDFVRLRNDFLHSFPNVTTLELRHCTFNWADLANLPRLTSLEVISPGEIHATSNIFIDTLQQLSLLTTLRLHRCLPIPTSTTMPSPTLTLPQLTSIDIADQNAKCTNFLHHVILHPALIIHLECWDFGSNVNWLIMFILIFWQTKTSSGKPVKSLNFAQHQEFSFQLQLATGDDPQLDTDMTIRCSEITQELAPNIFHLFLTIIDLQAVTVVKTDLELHETLWLYLAQRAPNVELIVYQPREIETFVHTLDQPDETGRYPWAFLKLNNMIFAQTCDTVSLTARRTLLKYLKAKFRTGNPCQILDLVTRDGLPRRYVAELEKYVVGEVFSDDDGISLAAESDDMYEADEEVN